MTSHWREPTDEEMIEALKDYEEVSVPCPGSGATVKIIKKNTVRAIHMPDLEHDSGYKGSYHGAIPSRLNLGILLLQPLGRNLPHDEL